MTNRDPLDTDYPSFYGLSFSFDGDDLPAGFALASAVHQKVTLIFEAKPTTSNINYVELITDEYWNGNGDAKNKLHQ